MSIHHTAIIEPGATIGENVTIGAYSIIGADVTLGDGCWIGPHVVINGPTTLGRENKIYQFASVGDAPQDKKYAGEPTRLEIGDRNVIRECCTINRGTTQDEGVTRIGNDNWIMAYVHIAHDCRVGNNTIMANNAALAGHVTIGDFAILGGYTIVHQFSAIGAHAFTALGSVISKDVPPYVMVSGHPVQAHGLNTEGLKRRGFSTEALSTLRKAYKVLYRQGLTLKDALAQIEAMQADCPELDIFVDFLHQQTRGIVR